MHQDGVIKSFISRAYAICSPENLNAELEFLKTVFFENDYDKKYINIFDTFKPSQQEREENTEIESVATLPWIPGLSTKLKKLFKNGGTKVTFKSTPNLQSILCKKNKSPIDEQCTSGVYKIPCSCGKEYVGETGATIKTRIT